MPLMKMAPDSLEAAQQGCEALLGHEAEAKPDEAPEA